MLSLFFVFIIDALATLSDITEPTVQEDLCGTEQIMTNNTQKDYAATPAVSHVHTHSTIYEYVRQ